MKIKEGKCEERKSAERRRGESKGAWEGEREWKREKARRRMTMGEVKNENGGEGS